MPIWAPGEGSPEEVEAMVRRFRPRALALLDPNRREHLFPSVADEVRGWGLDVRVLAAENPGDAFAVGR
jgi:hypothetical protein